MRDFDYKRSAAITRSALAALFALIMLSGCGNLWFHETFKVDGAAVKEVRSLGRVILQVQSDWTWKSTTQIDEILLMDVGASTFEASQDIAYKRLRQLGWSKHGNHSLESCKWGHVVVSFDSLDNLEAYGSLEQPIWSAVRAGPAKPTALMLIVLAPLG